MRLNGLICAAVLSVALAIPAAANAATIVGLYNTGVDDFGVKLADGAVDTHYKLNGSASPIVYTHPAYLTDPSAKFIAVQSDGNYVINPNTYSLSFDLTGYDFTTASISGLYAADNAGTVFLNGVQIAQQTQASIYPNFQQLFAFGANTGFQAGINTLLFSVVDYGPPAALLVTSLSGVAAAVPEPATWALFLLGFGAIGFSMRSARRKPAAIA